MPEEAHLIELCMTEEVALVILQGMTLRFQEYHQTRGDRRSADDWLTTAIKALHVSDHVGVDVRCAEATIKTILKAFEEKYGEQRSTYP